MVAERSLDFGLKIMKLRLFMGGVCNVLILKCYVIAAKKAQRRHLEGRKNAFMNAFAPQGDSLQ